MMMDGFIITYLALHLLDWGQTREIAVNPNYYEVNPIIGKYPTLDRVNNYFLISGAAVILSDKYLFKKNKYVRALFISVEAGFVINNHSIGIRVNF